MFTREHPYWLEDNIRALKRTSGCCRQLGQEKRFVEGLKLVRSIPGVGIISGLQLLTEAPELTRRFPDGQAFVRYLGLAPTEHSTGKTHERRGHLTQAGNALLRSMLVQAAWRLMWGDPQVHQRYQAIARGEAGNGRRLPWPGSWP